MRAKDLSNEQFGDWKVLKFSPNEKPGAYYLCRCICGTEKEIYGYNLTTGKTKSCGCSKGEDITGQKFNKLTVIKRTSQKTDYGRYLWECKCDCGNSIFITSSHFNSGEYISCGCLNTIDILGQKFGHLEVIKFSSEKTEDGRHLWECKCHNCESVCLKNGRDLRSGKIKSCGCLVSINYTGKVINKIQVLEKTELRNYGKCVVWKCLCHECNEICFISSVRLKENIIDCGCSRKSLSKGEIIGFLTVLEETNNRHNGSILWKCYCENCNSEKLISTKSLKSGRIVSCGCIKSVGETYIKRILDDNNISYDTEVKFADLIDERHLRFDFCIFNEDKSFYLIEFDGEQHNPISGMNFFLYKKKNKVKAQEEFDRLIKHDQMKNNYCLDNNIPLIRIPYKEINNLTLNLLQLKNNPFLIKI